MKGLSNSGDDIVYVDKDNLLESYVCSLYDQRATPDSSVNEVRLNMFMRTYKPCDSDSPLEKIKGIDASLLPPCNNVLQQWLKRCNYVTYLWKHATNKDPVGGIDVTDHGWEDVDGMFKPVWFVGDQIPTVLSTTIQSSDIIESDENQEDDDDGEEDHVYDEDSDRDTDVSEDSDIDD